MNLRKIVCPFLVVMLCVGCTSNTSSDVEDSEETIQVLHKEEQYLANLQYPKTPYDQLNNDIQTAIKEWEGSFFLQIDHILDPLPENNIFYESFRKSDRYVSIVLNMYQQIRDVKEDIKTFVYDMNTQKTVSINDILDDEQLKELAQIADHYFKERYPKECNNNRYRSHISAAQDNYQKFALKNDRIVFYFPAGILFDHAATLEVSYDQFTKPLSLKNEPQTVYVPYDDILNEPTKYIDPDKPMVALTFDDGPSKRYTGSILDALKENGASATFFVLGSNAQRNPDILQRMVLEGNEIGNHTFSHKQLTTLSKERIEDEIIATQESIYSITHTYPDLIRPPYGSKNDRVLQCTQGKQIVTWTMDTLDWKKRDTKAIVEYVEQNVKNGDIILLHDVYDTTAQAAVILIPKLKEMGYQLVTVSDLYEYQPQ